MKMILISKLTAFFIVSSLLFSCSSDPVDPPTPPGTALTSLQNKWILETITLYEHIDFSGQSLAFPGGNGSYFFDFHTNGKMYGYMYDEAFTPGSGKLDSSKYQLKADTLIVLNPYENGVLATETDTVSIRAMTKNSLILCSKNPAGEYAKFTFSR
jgi:hypothetical protein